ncbi:hypothetical protein BN874_480011 [Candidatus Contendobacter odensis Run_B_J11]|uniref:Uncharacterized protein n=1 Tax=Candidatus Contendobacter odensis Run_B_J11 TaxID=1400861 RepID=A0A7U7GEB7_9GAMM|nr:hypothetical protein BN874_480011 [Candidatus Contendobacter odensis Run_B_J11]
MDSRIRGNDDHEYENLPRMGITSLELLQGMRNRAELMAVQKSLTLRPIPSKAPRRNRSAA